MKPIIGVPCHGEFDVPADLPRRYTLNRPYVDGIRRAGGTVVMIPPSTEPESLRPVYNTLSGLLLAGGGDLQPSLYHQPDSGRCTGVDPQRDQAELLLARWAQEDCLPILGICRGIQTLNVALGGTLIQDIPSQVRGSLVHHPGPGQARGDPQHPVAAVPGSRLAAILTRGLRIGEVHVNSFHHQAIDEPALALRVVARAPDGVIEGVEGSSRAFVLGVQWHPEEMAAAQPAQQALFDAFVEAARARQARG